MPDKLVFLHTTRLPRSFQIAGEHGILASERAMAEAAANAGSISWGVTEEKILAALDRLVAAADPVKIIAFGSRAKGDAREDSDLDLAVILPRDAPRPSISLWSVLSGLRMSVDLIVADEARHERFRRSINSVHYDIAEEGVVLYRKGEHGSPDRDAVATICRRRKDDAA